LRNRESFRWNFPQLDAGSAGQVSKPDMQTPSVFPKRTLFWRSECGQGAGDGR
jgi:hypothetical protein